MKFLNKTLATVYFVLSVTWFAVGFFIYFKLTPHFATRDNAVLGVLAGVAVLVFGLIHLKLSNNIRGFLREKILVFCSSVNVVVLAIIFSMFYMLISLGAGADTSGFLAIIYLIPIAFVFSFFTLIFGVSSIV